MDIVQLHDLRFRPYIPAGAIQQRIKELAMEMNRDLKHENPLFIGILNGVFMFAGDLMKELEFNCEIIFVRYASYNGTKSSGSLGPRAWGQRRGTKPRTKWAKHGRGSLRACGLLVGRVS